MKRTGTITIEWVDSPNGDDAAGPNYGVQVRLDEPTPDEAVVAVLRVALALWEEGGSKQGVTAVGGH